MFQCLLVGLECFSLPLADDDRVYLLVDVAVENIGDDSEVIASRMQINLFDGEGKLQEWAVSVAANGSIDGKFRPGADRSGELAWEVSKRARGMRMTFRQAAFNLGDVDGIWVERAERLSARR